MAYEHSGEYPHAIEQYQRAIRLHYGEHRFYAALAHAYALDGDTRQAIKALTHAAWLSSGAVRAAYQSQCDAMRKH